MADYFKYRLDDGRFWGWRSEPEPDPECGYTQEPLPEYTYLVEIPVWIGTAWIVKPLINGQVAPD